MKEVTGVSFILQNADGGILMQLRDGKTTDYPHHWCFPGGGVEPNESYLETVTREVFEEFGIQLRESDCQFVTDFDEGRRINKIYLCQVRHPETAVLREGAEMKWMTLSEIEELKLGFNQNKLIPTIRELD